MRISAAGSGNPAPFATAGIAYHGFDFHRFLAPGADRRAIATMRKLLAVVRPDLVQCFDTKPNVLVPLAARDIAVVRTINGMGWVHSSRTPLALALRPVQRAMHRLAGRHTRVTVFQNRDDEAHFRRHRMIGAGRAHLIPGSGVDVAAFDHSLAEGLSAADLRDSLGLGTSEVVLTVSRLTRQKGIPALLRAASLVHAVRPGVRFVLAGPRESEGPLAVTQAELDRHAPYVLAIGPRGDVPALLRMADVFAFPTEYREGIPRALLEAALAGCPIVTTAMPGCTDVVRDGETGRVVPPHSPDRLAAAILELLEHTCSARAFGMRAGEVVRREFGLDLIAGRYHSVYETLLARAS
jgi:glycosyltransferase involved in cell wall biosynthesis